MSSLFVLQQKKKKKSCNKVMQSGSECSMQEMKNDFFMLPNNGSVQRTFHKYELGNFSCFSNVCNHRRQYCTREKPHYATNDMFESHCILHELPQL